jgi:hypothetical protein
VISFETAFPVLFVCANLLNSGQHFLQSIIESADKLIEVQAISIFANNMKVNGLFKKHIIRKELDNFGSKGVKKIEIGKTKKT